MVYTKCNIAAGGGGGVPWLVYNIIFPYTSDISLHILSKKDSLNGIHLNIPSTFCVYPLSVYPMIR